MYFPKLFFQQPESTGELHSRSVRLCLISLSITHSLQGYCAMDGTGDARGSHLSAKAHASDRSVRELARGLTPCLAPRPKLMYVEQQTADRWTSSSSSSAAHDGSSRSSSHDRPANLCLPISSAFPPHDISIEHLFIKTARPTNASHPPQLLGSRPSGRKPRWCAEGASRAIFRGSPQKKNTHLR